MKNPFDITCEIYNVWHTRVKPYIRKELSFIFETEIANIKNCIQKTDYKTALPIVQTLIQSFDPKDYQDKPYQEAAKRVLEKLKGLEGSIEGLS